MHHIVWNRLWQSAPARVGGLVLIFFYLLLAFADFFAPYSMHFADPDLANAPPTRIHFIIANGIYIEAICLSRQKEALILNTYKQIYSEA